MLGRGCIGMARRYGAQIGDEAAARANEAVNGVLVLRRDGIDATELRELALAIRGNGVDRLALIGTPDGEKVALVVALAKQNTANAKEVASAAAKIVGGGGGAGGVGGCAGCCCCWVVVVVVVDVVVVAILGLFR